MRADVTRWMMVWVLCASLVCTTAAQDRFTQLSDQLESAMVDHPGLDESVELSVNGVTIQEFVRALGANHKLNLSVDPKAQGSVVNDFTDARVSDVLLYLCKNYDLDIEFIGTIIALKPYSPPPMVKVPEPPRPMGVSYAADSALLDLDLRHDRLDSVAIAITNASGHNLVLAPGLEEKRVSVFLRRSPFDRAMDNLAFANGLTVTKARDGAYWVDAAQSDAKSDGKERSGGHARTGDGGGQIDLVVDDAGLLTLSTKDMPLDDLLEQVSRAMGVEFFLKDRPNNKVTTQLNRVSYVGFLQHVLAGTEHTHQEVGGVYMIGKRDQEGLRSSELVRLENRTVTDVMAAIPEGLKKDVVIQEFKELNGLVLSGSKPSITEIKAFLRQIDQTVPLINIEVLIVDVKRSRSVTTGISAGVGGENKPASSGGTILPDANYNLTSGTINALLNSFNGFGIFNLGNVKPDFYMSLQALETDGALKIRSTPQLSTLNGHEANLSIGETAYYLEIHSDIIGTQNPTIATSQLFKPIKADLSVKIMPIVSRDDMVTLEIEVTQSDFTERISNTAPPGSVERTFKSIVRVKNREMIALGGLEEKETNRSGRGLPLISRIPVLKWIFGSRTASSRKSKLTLFIRPTVMY
jgi:type IV pilus assembly protein PilQ